MIVGTLLGHKKIFDEGKLFKTKVVATPLSPKGSNGVECQTARVSMLHLTLPWEWNAFVFACNFIFFSWSLTSTMDESLSLIIRLPTNVYINSVCISLENCLALVNLGKSVQCKCNGITL